jgi:hypothetical protein
VGVGCRKTTSETARSGFFVSGPTFPSPSTIVGSGSRPQLRRTPRFKALGIFLDAPPPFALTGFACVY